MSFPTQLTVLRILLAPVFFVLFAVVEPTPYVWAALAFALGALSDWYDGYFARLWKLTTPLGAFLDPLADKLLTSAAFIAFASKGIIPEWTVLIIIARDVYVTLFRVLSSSIDQPIKTSSLAKYKTFFQMTYICYVLIGVMMASGTFGLSAVSFGIAMNTESILYWAVFGITILTLMTAVQYTYENAQVFRSVFRRYVFKRSPQELS
ncbi:MAG: CDP-diacylglycerol--glycerol-3-phosphate 3-phosphatidyltransferase [Bacteroidota bacterium]|nr:CDP-diacylglycerol--glycerol-3-phosphate 3-phosphatidyltransferase [Bacteroidota bacterium]MDP4230012.1 CDP-diacylglycerol--glycerol-3-phosphate 3-phosphatidyltransferase [Bacteroidota bacterium]MDP4234821.1 CDP-diacylglycerol--glycerol-3-phosphate 3-phosphatidyltransferase [Bacteroidota bacterium]